MKLVMTLLAALAFTLPNLAQAFGDNYGEFSIGTGSKGKAYYTAGTRIAAIAGEIGFTVNDKSVLPSKGSEMNIIGVYKGQILTGLAQADAYAAMLRKYPDLITKAPVWARLGEECVFLAGARGGRVTHEDHLERKGVKVAVDRKGSGTWWSWNLLTSLNPDMNVAVPMAVSGLSALSQIEGGTIDAMIFTTSPKFKDHANFRFIEASKKLKLFDLDDASMNEDLHGKPVYTFRDVKVAGQTVEVPCTDLLLIGQPGVDDFAREQLIEAVLLQRNSLL